MPPPAAALALCLALPLAACGGAEVIGRSDDVLLLRVDDPSAVAGTRADAAEHCAETARTARLSAQEPMGDGIMVRWTCR